MRYNIILFLIAITIFSSLVYAGPVIKQDDDVFISKTARLDGAISGSVVCNITLRDPDDITLIPLSVMIFNTSTGQQEFFVDRGNHSKLGIYTYPISCTGAGLNKTKIYVYEINPSGKEYIPEITGPLLFGAILTLMFVSIVLLVISAKIELFPLKVFLMILAGMIAILNIGFVSGSFQEFFSTESALSGSFGTVYIAFVMLLVASSVFLIIWIVLAGFKVYRIKRGFFIEE